MSTMNTVGRPTAPNAVTTKPATLTGGRGLLQNEALIFEGEGWGKTGVDLPDPKTDGGDLGDLVRKDPIGLPGLSEPEAMRHYVRLSQKNHAIDLAIYPLGSCTMKHNPRLNEKMARLPGFSDIHPLQPISTVQGALELMDTLAHWLKTLTGMPAVALSPKAGAHGELCGLMAIRAAHEASGQHEKRRKVLVPTSAHGTNPATAAFVGYSVVEVAQTEDGRVDVADLAAKLGDDVAAIMVTNPNTCGLFERDIIEIARLTHEAGAYFYCDGANFNAIVGRVRPGDLGVDAMHINLHKTFSTPHGGGGPGAGPVVLSEALAAFAPAPWVVHDDKWLSPDRARGRRGGTGLWSSVRLPGPDGHVCARPVLHDVARLGRPASGGRGRGAERQLHQGPPVGPDERRLPRRPLHARGSVRRRMAEGHGYHHARFRQGDDRRGLPPDDHVFPAGRPRRHAD